MTDGSCDDLFASWLLARENGEERDIESLAAEHPECAQALRAQHAELRRLESVLGLSSSPSDSAAGPDPDAPPDPGLVLVPPAIDETVTNPASLLERLTKRGPPKERFVVKEKIGKGGMGAVFRVYDAEIGRHLAAKVLHFDDPAYLPRFLEEVQITGQLDHPTFIPVHDLALDEKGRVFFTMKLVKGITDEKTEEIRAETLSDVIEKIHAKIEDWTLTRGLDVIVRVAEAMEFAHVKGVIHRDLKPLNILVGRYGEVYVTDFGVARVQGKERAPIPETAQRFSQVRIKRRDAIPPTAASPISPGPTEEGDTIGTAEYMPLEQAEGRRSDLGPHSDIYSLGATLYHLLASVPPWHTHDDHPAPRVIIRKALAGARPAPLHALAPSTPAELLAIVEKAMAVKPKDRYPSMKAFAADLRAYLDRRVVTAYETGAIAELKKWVQRNPYLTAAAALLVVVLVGSSVVLSWKNTEIQRQKATVDAKNREVEAKNVEVTQQKNLVEARKAEFDQLAGKVYLERALEREKDLYPPWPSKIEAMERWLSEDAKRLLDLKPTLDSTLSDLRARALPQIDEERERDRTTHPKFGELESLRPRLVWLRSRLAALAATSPPSLPTLPVDLESKAANELNDFAWKRVDPDFAKRVFGEEALALVAARRAVAKIDANDTTSELGSTLDTLAWACFANGLDAEARAVMARAIDVAEENNKAEFRSYSENLEKAIAAYSGDAGAKLLGDLEAQVAALETAVNARQTYTFALESETFLYTTLSDLGASIASFESGAKTHVEQRLAWAKKIGDLTLRHPNARVTWDEARAAILKADGVVASKLYAQSPGVPLDLKPQMGLVPIGMNPVTKLWEFYELRSACDLLGGQDPATLEIPAHREDGSIEVKDGTGIVFVLLPGGTFLQGAQNSDPSAPNYDPRAESDESLNGKPVSVTLAPFFLAKHETTQGQWLRLSGTNPSYWMSLYPNLTGLDRPVEYITWEDCEGREGLCRRVGLSLPTEARWEYGCRAGTSTVFSFGDAEEEMVDHGNVQDASFARVISNTDPNSCDTFDDGEGIPCRVGRYAGNGFGLFDMHGNIWEWCQDGYGSYATMARAGDGLRAAEGASMRVSRGGGYNVRAVHARSALRIRYSPDIRSISLGARFARSLD